jgi:hypothetical protein
MCASALSTPLRLVYQTYVRSPLVHVWVFTNVSTLRVCLDLRKNSYKPAASQPIVWLFFSRNGKNVVTRFQQEKFMDYIDFSVMVGANKRVAKPGGYACPNFIYLI